MRIDRSALGLFFAPALVFVGSVWMFAAVAHFEELTGRRFYGLAAQHYSVPKWEMVYHPGGEHIYFWTVTVPGVTTFALVLLMGIAVSFARWRELTWLPLFGLWVYHGLWLIVLAGVTALISISITGVFI